FALADMAAEFARLLERHPHRRGEAPRDRLRPEEDDVHARIGLAIVAKRPGYAPGCVCHAPGAHPGTDALFEIGNDSIGDPRVDIDARLLFFPAHFPEPPFWRPRRSRPSHGVRKPGQTGETAHPQGRNEVEDGEAVA